MKIILILVIIANINNAFPTPMNNLLELNTLLNQKYSNANDVITNLEKLNQYFLKHKMNELYFNSIYSLVTKGIKEKIQNNDFDYPHCMELEIISFSKLYQKALKQYLLKNELMYDSAWGDTFSENKKIKSKPTLQLALGMNAHIMQDLPMAIAQNAIDNNECSLLRIKNDYFQLNRFFDQMVLRLNSDLKYRYDQLNSRQKSHEIWKKINTIMLMKIIRSMRSYAWIMAKQLDSAYSDDQRTSINALIRQNAIDKAKRLKTMSFVLPERGL